MITIFNQTVNVPEELVSITYDTNDHWCHFVPVNGRDDTNLKLVQIHQEEYEEGDSGEFYVSNLDDMGFPDDMMLTTATEKHSYELLEVETCFLHISREDRSKAFNLPIYKIKDKLYLRHENSSALEIEELEKMVLSFGFYSLIEPFVEVFQRRQD